MGAAISIFTVDIYHQKVMFSGLYLLWQWICLSVLRMKRNFWVQKELACYLIDGKYFHIFTRWGSNFESFVQIVKLKLITVSYVLSLCYTNTSLEEESFWTAAFSTIGFDNLAWNVDINDHFSSSLWIPWLIFSIKSQSSPVVSAVTASTLWRFNGTN